MRQIHRIGVEKGIKGLKGKIAGASRKRASSLRCDSILVRLAGIGGILPSWLNHPVHDSFRHSARIVGKALLPPAQSRRIPRLDQHSGKASPCASSLHAPYYTHSVRNKAELLLHAARYLDDLWLIEQFWLTRKM